MEEKYMVNDILENNKFQISFITESLVNSENFELKQILEQLRSTSESLNFELFNLATSKGYYYSNIKATPEDISQIKNIFI